MAYHDDYDVWRLHGLDRGHLTRGQKTYFDNAAVWLCTRNEDVGRENGRRLARRAQAEELIVRRASVRHSAHKAAKRQPSSALDGLRPAINLARGCKARITRSIAANGAHSRLVSVA